MQKLQPESELVNLYLREIARFPLLTSEQEVVFGQQVQKMMVVMEVKQTLARRLRREPTLQEWAARVGLSENQLERILRRGKQAKQKMIEANLRLVIWVAKNHQQRGLELADLIQEGTLGLIRAVEKFQPNQGNRFSTYAVGWIRQAITRATDEKGRTIRLPVHMFEKLRRISKTQQQLLSQLGRLPTSTEISAHTSMTPEQIQMCIERSRQPLSLNKLVGESQTELGELIESTVKETESEGMLLRQELREKLKKLLSTLTPQQRQVLTLRFGLIDGQGLSLAQVSRRLHVSKEGVRQAEKKALERLKRHEQCLVDYLAEV